MLQWWAEFRDGFSTEKYCQSIIWTNKDVRINNAPVFYETFFESAIIYINDLLFDLNNINSYNIISKNVGKVNFLTWAGLRHAIKHKIKNKFEIEECVNIKNNTLDRFKRKWTINCNLFLNI